MNGNTKIKDGQFGIILLEGKHTINAQIKERTKALNSCLKEKGDVSPLLRETWAINHVRVIFKLQKLKNQ